MDSSNGTKKRGMLNYNECWAIPSTPSAPSQQTQQNFSSSPSTPMTFSVLNDAKQNYGERSTSNSGNNLVSFNKTHSFAVASVESQGNKKNSFSRTTSATGEAIESLQNVVATGRRMGMHSATNQLHDEETFRKRQKPADDRSPTADLTGKPHMKDSYAKVNTITRQSEIDSVNPTSTQPRLPHPIFCCAACGAAFFDTFHTSAEELVTPVTNPVLLIPCGHTVCATCVVSVSSASDGDSSCPCCHSVVAFQEKNIPLEGLISAASVTRDQQKQEDTFRSIRGGLMPGGGVLSAAVEEGPLPPTLRRQIYDVCREEAAVQAEMFARRVLAHRRRAAMRQREQEDSFRELTDATAIVRRKSAVGAKLQEELQSVEAQIQQLKQERQLVLTQLSETWQERMQAAVREQECQLRYGLLRENVERHTSEASMAEALLSQFVAAVDFNAYI